MKKKTTKTKPFGKRLGRGTSPAKLQGLYLKNGVDILTFVRQSTTACHRNYFVLVCFRFSALNTYNWSCAVISLNICLKLCKKHALEHREVAGSEKKKKSVKKYSYGKRMITITLFEGL